MLRRNLAIAIFIVIVVAVLQQRLAMPLLLAAMLPLAECIQVGEDAPHAEARPGL